VLNGIEYCNELEFRVAKILIRHKIEFEYSKEFETVNKDGQPNHRQVDFWLKEPINVFWCNEPVQALEVKGGKLDDRAWEQRRELDAVGVKTWIVLPQYVKFWEHDGFLRANGLYRGRGRKK
jgi:hypothetical protein